ncbi:MAG: hypothetical protein ACRC0A_05700, partial [Chitinophagaceae bacterium]
YQSTISQWIAGHKELEDEVRFINVDTPLPASALYIQVVDDTIIFPIDWYNVMPPLCYPSLSFNENTLLGILYSKIGNAERALHYLENYPSLVFIAEVLYALQYGLDINTEWVKNLLREEGFLYYHNTAIAFHYGTENYEQAQPYYEQAIALATDKEYIAFTIKHYALYWIDKGNVEQAEKLLNDTLQTLLSSDASIELNAVLLSILVKKNRVEDTLKILTLIQKVYHYYDKTGQELRKALLLMDTLYIGDSSNESSEVLQAIEKAIAIFKIEEQQDLYINACIKKGTLLLTWAKSGNLQFYQPAVKIFKEVLQTIDREHSPHIFAEVHHHLGVIYAEIPDEIKKKSLWAGISVSSFNEALRYFTKENYPYEYALICHNFGTAYTKYPVAVLSNNFDKALEWYTEALSIRTQYEYPLERVRTLLNYLEASWYATNENDEIEKIQKLKNITQEIYTLTDNEELIASVNEHLARLKEAEHIFNQK